MNNNPGSCILIKFAPTDVTPQDLADFLDSFFEVTACNYTDNGQEEYVGYANADLTDEALIQAARQNGIKLPPYKKEQLESKNWLTENVIKFDPIEAGDFVIYGVHEQQPPQTAKKTLKIYAATAFGDGHQTTRSCLQAVSDLNAAGFTPSKILDMGTGSGILALACAKLWRDEAPAIVAVDIDEEAVRVTKCNAADNGLENLLQIGQSDGYRSALVKNNAPYDLIIANILARPLIEMAPDLSSHLRPGGYCILSGFIDDQVGWVTDAHHDCGLQIVKVYDMDHWHAALMQKTV